MPRKRKRRKASQGKTLWWLLLVVLGSLAYVRGKPYVLDHLPLVLTAMSGVVALLVLVLWARFAAHRRRTAQQRERDRRVASTDGMKGPEFEQLVARLLERDGYSRVTVSGGAGDLGADVTALTPEGLRLVVQCKRYSTSRSVSSPDMQRFLGTCFDEHGADEAWFVTTTRFSRPAAELGTRRGVRLIDRDALSRWMSHTGATPTPVS